MCMYLFLVETYLLVPIPSPSQPVTTDTSTLLFSQIDNIPVRVRPGDPSCSLSTLLGLGRLSKHLSKL
jgi:hypothetical protein